MSNILVAFFAYVIDRGVGEFNFIKHPVIYMGELISFFEKKFYKDSLFRGILLVLFVLSVVLLFAYIIERYVSVLPFAFEVLILCVVSSMFIAHKMLRDSVYEVLDAEDKKKTLSMLVSRDTDKMKESDIYKAAIETYAENLNDGVVAPIFYLILFGIKGIVVYKAVNTMDSMVGYKNDRYEKFGKAAAKLDDVLNYIPSRITAVLIMLFGKKRDVFAFYRYGKKHESPNAGHPIAAMALVLGIKLGGDAYYFGKLKKKAYFGDKRDEVKSQDLISALRIF